MSALREIEPISAHHIHELGEKIKSIPDPDVEFYGGTYPVTIFHAQSGEYILNHFSAFEPGVERMPDSLVRYRLNKEGEITEKVLFGFELVLSSDIKMHEFKLISGYSNSENNPGYAGSIKAKNVESISNFFGYIITGHDKFSKSFDNVQINAEALNFLIEQNIINKDFDLEGFRLSCLDKAS